MSLIVLWMKWNFLLRNFPVGASAHHSKIFGVYNSLDFEISGIGWKMCTNNTALPRAGAKRLTLTCPASSFLVVSLKCRYIILGPDEPQALPWSQRSYSAWNIMHREITPAPCLVRWMKSCSCRLISKAIMAHVHSIDHRHSISVCSTPSHPFHFKCLSLNRDNSYICICRERADISLLNILRVALGSLSISSLCFKLEMVGHWRVETER